MEVDLSDHYSFYEAPDHSSSYGIHHMLLVFRYMRAVLGAKYSKNYIVFLQYFINKYYIGVRESEYNTMNTDYGTIHVGLDADGDDGDEIIANI